MNTYDPAACVRYVHLDGGLACPPLTTSCGPTGTRLPSGYANASPLTTLRGRAAARTLAATDRRAVRPLATCS
jgi:hypothetical protein